MKKAIQLKNIVAAVALTIACITLPSAARATLDPPPDGGYTNENTAEGIEALSSLQFGIDGGDHNTAIGFETLSANTTGDHNTGLGADTLAFNSIGNDNTAAGYLALFLNTTGSRNVALGTDALYSNLIGIDNTATGVNALFNNTGNYNTATGYQAMESNTTGTNNTGSAGAAYVFARSGATWSQQAYLKASNTNFADQFAYSVAASGDTVVVGAWLESSNATGINGNQADNSAFGAGAAYVFVRNGTTWGQQAYLKASNTELQDRFGISVAIDGDTGVVGAELQPSQETRSGAAYVFTGLGETMPIIPLLNISTRMNVGTDENVLIGGFIVIGTDPKKVIIRAIGPSLADMDVPDALADPILELHMSDGSVVTNDNWRDSQEQEIIDSTVPPSNNLESAIVATLEPGPYTAIVSGKNNSTGIGLVEVYDLDQAADSQLANISTRGFVDTGDNVMIGGFIVGGDNSTTVLVRALGPSLGALGIDDPLQDPTLELHDADGVQVASDDNWRDTQEQEIIDTTIAPTDDREAAILADLTPAAYTAILRGKNNTTGVGLMEVYNLQ